MLWARQRGRDFDLTSEATELVEHVLDPHAPVALQVFEANIQAVGTREALGWERQGRLLSTHETVRSWGARNETAATHHFHVHTEVRKRSRHGPVAVHDLEVVRPRD